MSTFDESSLSEDDVQYLLNALKHPKEQLKIDEIRTKISESVTLLGGSEIDGNAVILGIVDDIEYILHIHCGDALLPIESLSYSIHLRFKQSNLHLARLDINQRHKNPWEKTAKRYSHIHIYTPEYANKSRVAIPIDVNEFPNISNIARTLEDFFKRTNIRTS